MGLEDIVKNNHYPIIFIGSGISKRYLASSPTWSDLLEEYWNKLGKKQNFYSYLHEINKKFIGESDIELEFHTNTYVASYIEKSFNDCFYQEKLKVDGLSLKKAQQQNLSPFKFDLANRFSSTKLKKNLNKKEFESFKTLLQKSRMIVTTNYDSLIETTIEKSSRQNPKVYVGNSGFFDNDAEGWSEIYKIHGSSSAPNSIIIDESDYKKYDNNSILISAKILSSMIDSPILFLGYSLKDRNVRKLLEDFSKQLPAEDTRKSANRIFVIEYKENEPSLDERIIRDTELNFTYTHIQTDNYQKLYSEVCKIDEGVTPYEVRRFQKVIKKIIISSGHKKALDSYLVRPVDLEKLENKIDDGKPIVVALGDTKNIFVTPTPTLYISDYILQKFDILPENALRFIAGEQPMGRYPFLKHYNDLDINNCVLEKFEKERLNDRFKRDLSSIEELLEKINFRNRLHYDNIEKILALDINEANQVDLITYNSQSIKYSELTNYIQNMALPNFIKYYKARDSKKIQEKSAYRKLFVAWDIITYGK